MAEDYIEELEHSDNDGVEAEQKTSPHFLGAVVLSSRFQRRPRISTSVK